MNNLRSLMSAMLLALAVAAPSVQAADESPWKFEFHGFLTASMYYQDQAFAQGQGQGLLFMAPAPINLAPCKASGAFSCTPTATQTAAGSFIPATKSASILSGDVRNSRFSFSMSGPKVFTDAQPRAYLEFDLFGPNGAGTFGSEQNIPRIRVAIVELKMGNTNIQVGQQNQLVVTQIPGSISHIANPVTYGAGTIAWRTPGIRVAQTIPLDGMKLELAAEAVKNKWSNELINALGGVGTGSPYSTAPYCTQAAPVAPATIGAITCTQTGVGSNTPLTLGYGEASGMPMFQARVKLDGTAGGFKYMGYLVGVFHSIKLDGFGAGVAPPAWAAGKKSIDGNVFEVGGNLTYSPVALSFNYYTGKATGNMLGSMLYFGDIKDSGYWVQLAGNFTKELSLNIAYGAGTPNEADIRRVATSAALGGTGARLANTLMGGMLKYQDGGYALGVEFWRNTTKWADSPTTHVSTSATQVIGTAAYFF